MPPFQLPSLILPTYFLISFLLNLSLYHLLSSNKLFLLTTMSGAWVQKFLSALFTDISLIRDKSTGKNKACNKYMLNEWINEWIKNGRKNLKKRKNRKKTSGNISVSERHSQIFIAVNTSVFFFFSFLLHLIKQMKIRMNNAFVRKVKIFQNVFIHNVSFDQNVGL